MPLPMCPQDIRPSPHEQLQLPLHTGHLPCPPISWPFRALGVHTGLPLLLFLGPPCKRDTLHCPEWSEPPLTDF